MNPIKDMPHSPIPTAAATQTVMTALPVGSTESDQSDGSDAARSPRGASTPDKSSTEGLRSPRQIRLTQSARQVAAPKLKVEASSIEVFTRETVLDAMKSHVARGYPGVLVSVTTASGFEHHYDALEFNRYMQLSKDDGVRSPKNPLTRESIEQFRAYLVTSPELDEAQYLCSGTSTNKKSHFLYKTALEASIGSPSALLTLGLLCRDCDSTFPNPTNKPALEDYGRRLIAKFCQSGDCYSRARVAEEALRVAIEQRKPLVALQVLSVKFDGALHMQLDSCMTRARREQQVSTRLKLGDLRAWNALVLCPHPLTKA